MEECERLAELEVERTARGGMSHEEYGRASGRLSALRGIPRWPADMADALDYDDEEDAGA